MSTAVDLSISDSTRLDLTAERRLEFTSNDLTHLEVAMNLRERCTYVVGYS